MIANALHVCQSPRLTLQAKCVIMSSLLPLYQSGSELKSVLCARPAVKTDSIRPCHGAPAAPKAWGHLATGARGQREVAGWQGTSSSVRTAGMM